jgi:cytochrome oxidase Cu insertion factor (SCO1/SenC/PrrC family)
MVALVLAGLVTVAGFTSVPAAPAGNAGRGHARLWDALELARPSRPVEAPAFELRDVGGRTVTLKEFRGRVVLLYFWATW